MLATPFWGRTPPTVNPNAVFFSGGDVVRDLVADRCSERGLELLALTALELLADASENVSKVGRSRRGR